MDDEKKKLIKISYEKDKDYRLYPVTGAYGGLSLSGEFILDFYVERREPPENVTLELSKDGDMKEVAQSKQKTCRIRQFGIVVRPDIAFSIGNLLIEKSRLMISQGGEDGEGTKKQ